MTIEVTSTYTRYAGNGVTTVFPFAFKCFSTSELVVRDILDSTGVPTTKTLGTHYYVALANGEGGSITFFTAPSSGHTIDIRSLVELTQPEDIRNQGRFLPEIHEQAFDRLDRQNQDTRRIANAGIHAPDYEVSLDMSLPSVANRIGKYAAFDALGQPVASVGTGNDSALRTDLATTTAGIEGARLVGYRSAGTASVASSVYAALRGLLHVSMFGAVGDGTTDDRAAVQAAIDAANAAGGGQVVFDWGKTYRLICGGATTLGLQSCALVKAGVILLAFGATINCEANAANQTPVWLFGNGTGITGAIVNGIYSGGGLSSQTFFGCAVAVGVPNNCGDSAASPSAGQFMRDWSVRGCTLSTNRALYPALAIQGGANSGTVSGNHVPDSANCSAYHLDWGNTGTISAAAIAAAKAAFLANTAYTTHPNNIEFIGNSVGTLSVVTVGDSGAFAVRASACYNILVDGMQVESVAHTGYMHVGGDLGFEFARPEDKRHAYQGMVCRRMVIRNAATAMLQGAYVDTLGDNVFREQFLTGYVALANPLWHGDISIENCSFAGADQNNTYGVRIIQARGVRVCNRTRLQRWKWGVYIDEFTQDVDVDGTVIFGNRDNGIQVGTQQLREGTARINISRNRIYGNGTAATAFGVRVTRGVGIRIFENDFGVPGEAVQARAVLVDDIAGANRDIRIVDNRNWGSTSTPYNLQSGAPADALMYRVIAEFRNNMAPGCSAIAGGQTYIPTLINGIGSSMTAFWQNPNTAVPADGTWYRGDWLKQSGPATATKNGDECTFAGTVGVLAAITNGVTTNGSADITCSIAGVTCTTTLAGYSVVVSSATGMRPGMKCSIAAAGITNANILSVSGTTLQLDTQANAALVGTAFTTCGLIEGEVFSLNTAPARSSCVVLKINGTTVSFDTTMGSNEVGRTLSYTAPVFKAEAALA